MISELLREALLSQGCGKVKRDGRELQQHCTPNVCFPGTLQARMKAGIPRVRGAFQCHRAGQELTEELTALGVLRVHHCLG